MGSKKGQIIGVRRDVQELEQMKLESSGLGGSCENVAVDKPDLQMAVTGCVQGHGKTDVDIQVKCM